MPTENEGTVQDLGAAGKSLIDQWTASMAGFAQRIDNGTLTVDDVVKTWATSTKLGLQGWRLAYSALGEPTTKSAPGPDQGADMAVSGFFQIPQSLAPGGKRLLNVVGPLVSDVGGHQIPVSEITLKPPELGPTEQSFRLQFPKGTHPKLIYRGKVELHAAASQPALATIDVTVEVK